MAQAHIIVLDSLNEDIFVCGLCKSVYTSLDVFLSHKRLECTFMCSMNVLENIMLPDPMSSDIPTTSNSASDTEISLHQDAYTIPESPCDTGTGTSSHQETYTIPETRCDTGTSLHQDTYTIPEKPCDIPPVGLPCPICGRMFKSRKTQSLHIKSHYVRPYQCPICGRCFIQNSHLQRHIISHKVWPESVTETTPTCSEVELLSYSCPFCKVVSSNYNKFRSHLKDHEDIKKFKCIQGDCMHFFENMKSLLQHVLSAHKQPVYACCICKEPFHSLETISTHQQMHNDIEAHVPQKTQYKCTLCDAVFIKPEKLSLHMLTESHRKMCIHCNKVFPSDKRLRLHLQIHRKTKPFQCNICNSSFHLKKYLATHMLKHERGKFTCTVCNSVFIRQDMLQRHMKLHQSNQLLECPYKEALDCKRQFSRKDKLTLHVKSHIEHAASPSSVLNKDNEQCKEVNEDFNENNTESELMDISSIQVSV